MIENKLTTSVKPMLSDDEQQVWFGRLKASLSECIKVTVTVCVENVSLQYDGVVTGLDPRFQLIKLEMNRDWKLFEFKDIIRVDFYAL